MYVYGKWVSFVKKNVQYVFRETFVILVICLYRCNRCCAFLCPDAFVLYTVYVCCTAFPLVEGICVLLLVLYFLLATVAQLTSTS